MSIKSRFKGENDAKWAMIYFKNALSSKKNQEQFFFQIVIRKKLLILP